MSPRTAAAATLLVFLLAPAARAGELPDRAGERLRGAWGWSSEGFAVEGDPGHEIALGPSTAKLEALERALAALEKAGAPVLEIERTGTVGGEAAAVISRTPGAVWSSSDARWDAWRADASVADLDRIARAVGRLHGQFVPTGLLVTPDGHVLIGAAKHEPANATKAARAVTLERLDGWRKEARAAARARDLVASGREPDVTAARKVALYLESEGVLDGPSGSIGLVGALEGETWPRELGSIAPASGTLAADAYRRGSYGKKAEVAVHELAAKGDAPRALVYQSSLAIDADGSGKAWRSDPDGQPDTSLDDARGRALDPTKVPYFVLPLGFADAHPGVKLGDIAAVIHDGKVAYAIWGDEGPPGQIGEGSILLAKELGIDASPTDGGVPRGVTYVVFPGSGTGGALSRAEIERRGAELFERAGGAP